MEIFLKAQEIYQRRREKYESETMLAGLKQVFEDNDFFRPSLLRKAELPAAANYGRKFGSLDFAFQQLFTPLRNEARRDVESKLQTALGEVQRTEFLVQREDAPKLDGFFSVDDQLRARAGAVDIIAQDGNTAGPFSLSALGSDFVPDAFANDLSLELGEGQQDV